MVMFWFQDGQVEWNVRVTPRTYVGVGQFMSRAEVSGQVEGLFSTVVHMEMRSNEVNTVNFTSLRIVTVIKGTGDN